MSQSKHTKILSFVLASIIVASAALVSCAKKADDTSEGTTADTSAVTEPVDPRMAVSDDLPEMNFEGYDFRIQSRSADMYLCEVYTEAEDGEIRNDALYKRNRTVEERFNVKISAVTTTVEEDMSEVMNPILANDDSFDIGLTMCYVTGPVITNGLLINWLKVDHINLDKPWWINGINTNFQIGDAIYTIVGDTCMSTLMLTYGVYYNIRLANDYRLPDLYDLVRNNKWTIDDFITLTKDVYNDLNGDGTRDTGDFYSFTGEAATNLDVYPLAFDIPIIDRNDEGMPEIVINSPKMLAAIEKINELYWGSTGSFIGKSDDYARGRVPFANYNAIFNTSPLASMYGEMRSFEDEYGVLPYPKWDEQQEKYMTGAMDRYSIIILPKTNTDLERTGIITEAINAESYRILFPAWYEDSAQDKFARDEGTIEMLDVIMQGRNFDMVTLFSNNWNSLPWMFRDLVAANSVGLPGKWTAAEKQSQTALEKIITAYTENA